jgi:hypothetical protein
MEWLRDVSPATVGALIPIVAIVVGGALAITKAIIRHRERLAMIERGIHPDSVREKDKATRDTG